MIRGYIFDLDGTLLDTLASLAASYNRSLVKLGFPPHEVNAYRRFVGDGQRKCVERALPADAMNDENVLAMMQAQQDDYTKTWREQAAPYPGVPEALAALKRRGAKLTVLSNKNHPFAVKCVEYFFPRIRFDAIQGFDDDVPHKPNPTGALRIAAKLGLKPAEIVFVGDTSTDILTAKACAMSSVGVLWGFRDATELNNAGATHIIDHPSELLDLNNAGGDDLAAESREQ